MTRKTVTYCRYVSGFLALVLICMCLPVYTKVSLAHEFQKRAPVFSTNLREIVSMGVISNPEFARDVHRQLSTRSQLDQAKALKRPTIDLFMEAGYEKTDSPFTQATTISGTETLFRRQVSLTVNQLLFDGFNATNEIRRQIGRTELARFQVISTAERLAGEIASAYIDVYENRKLHEISIQNINTHQKIFKQIQESVRAGRLSKADLQQVTARLSVAKANESQARRLLKQAEANYKRIVGVFPQNLDQPSAPYKNLPDKLPKMIERALNQSPDIQISEKAIAIAEVELDQTVSPFYPRVDLRFNGRRSDDTGGVDIREDSLSALLVLTWDLYSGGEDLARYRQFAHLYDAAKTNLGADKREVENLVRVNWARLEAAKKRRVQFEQQADSAKRLVGAYLDQFQLGRRTLLDVLDIQNEYFVSQSNAISQKSQEQQEVYTLLSQAGELMPALGISYPNLVEYND